MCRSGRLPTRPRAHPWVRRHRARPPPGSRSRRRGRRSDLGAPRRIRRPRNPSGRSARPPGRGGSRGHVGETGHARRNPPIRSVRTRTIGVNHGFPPSARPCGSPRRPPGPRHRRPARPLLRRARDHPVQGHARHADGARAGSRADVLPGRVGHHDPGRGARRPRVRVRRTPRSRHADRAVDDP